jgi:hypothetical protein
MIMTVKQSVVCELVGENKVLGENLHQCHFVHHKSHTMLSGLKPELPLWESSD